MPLVKVIYDMIERIIHASKKNILLIINHSSITRPAGLFSFFVVPILMSDIMIDFMAMIDIDIDITVNATAPATNNTNINNNNTHG